MSTNHDVYKLSPILSNESIDLKMRNHENNWSTLNNHGCTWTSNCNTSIVSDTSSIYTTEYYKSISSNASNSCPSQIHDQSSSVLSEYFYNGSNIFQSLKNINTSCINTYNNGNGDPLDYSIHSSIDNLKDPTLTLNKSHIQLRSNYIQPSISQKNQDNIQSPCILKNTTISSPMNTETTGGRLLKRKYSKNISNLSKKYTEKQLKTETYKYLTWREKDRRRRFREEWKHLWLVIPYGLYEVMCLVCHKVMTQRKVDTIKRHTVRRHVELIGMSDSEREKLFDQLIKQYTMLRVTNYNSSNDVPNQLHQKSDCLYQTDSTKNCDELSNVKASSEVLTNNLNNTNTCLFEQHSVMNRLKKIDTKNNNSMNRESDFQHLLTKQDKQLNCKSYQTTNTIPRYSRNSCSKKYKSLPEVKQDRSIIENLQDLPTNIPENWDDPSIFEEESFPLRKSLLDTPRNHCDRLEQPYNKESFHAGKLGSKVIPSNTNSMIPSFSPFSTVVPISKCSSCTYPSESENFHNFLKSYVSMNSLLSSPNIPTSSISSLLMPQIFPTFNSSNRLSTSMKSTSSLYTNSDISCHTGSNNRDNNNDSDKSHQNHQLSSTEKQTTINDYRKRSNHLLESSINTEMSLTNSMLTNNNKKNIKVPYTQQCSTQNTYDDSHNKSVHSSNLQISSNPSIPRSLPFTMSTFMEDFSKHEIDDGIFPKTPESRIHTLVNKRKSVHTSNPELFNDCPNNHKISDRKTDFISRKEDQVLNPSGTKSNCRSKSNSGSKQFTISSLLNIESLSSQNKTSLTTHHDELIPDIQKKDTISPGYDYPNWSTQNPQEKRELEQLPISCVLCNSESVNNCTDDARKQFISNVPSEDNLFRTNNDSLDISITKQIDAFKERQSAFSSPTGLSNVSVHRKLLEQYTSIPELYQSYTDIFHLIYCLKNQIPINCLSNSNIFHNQNLETLGTYMKLYYLELLRHHYDVPSTDLSTQSIPTTLCSYIHEENELVNYKKCTNELQKSPIID
uniref:SPIN-DOC-like zinc-finger domain-containing protein n=2 Tax=Schistosoma haematobium TaxID=6185 RepID=A0A095AI97_SCHHA